MPGDHYQSSTLGVEGGHILLPRARLADVRESVHRGPQMGPGCCLQGVGMWAEWEFLICANPSQAGVQKHGVLKRKELGGREEEEGLHVHYNR